MTTLLKIIPLIADQARYRPTVHICKHKLGIKFFSFTSQSLEIIRTSTQQYWDSREMLYEIFVVKMGAILKFQYPSLNHWTVGFTCFLLANIKRFAQEIFYENAKVFKVNDFDYARNIWHFNSGWITSIFLWPQPLSINNFLYRQLRSPSIPLTID